MAKNQDVFFTKTPNVVAVKFVAGTNDTATNIDGSAGTVQVIATGGADDSIIRSISMTSSDTAARDVLLFISNSATPTTSNTLIGIINVPITAGFATGVASVNGLNGASLPFLRLDKDGNRILVLKTGWYLKAGLKTALTASSQVNIVCISEDY